MLLQIFILTIFLVISVIGASYPNPGKLTGDVWAHDPTLIRLSSGYVVYATGTGIPARTSSDRVAFSVSSKSGLPNGASWASSYTNNAIKELWAPDISLQGGKYLLYYSASTFGSRNSAIGLATSSSGQPGTFTDQGKVFASSSSSSYNAIDPNLFVDTLTKKWWMTFGSFSGGIYQVELDPSSGKVRQGAEVKNIAARPDVNSRAIEAPFIFKHGSYYYLFVSFDLCCKGTKSTYRIMVGRSNSPNGPFADKSGKAMLKGGGTEILSTHDTVIGPGGQSVYTDAGKDLLVYHYYDGANNGAIRLGINYLCWGTDNWPTVC